MITLSLRRDRVATVRLVRGSTAAAANLDARTRRLVDAVDVFNNTADMPANAGGAQRAAHARQDVAAVHARSRLHPAARTDASVEESVDAGWQTS
ncbi:protein of unknown function [Burkholderia multivorans]